MHGLQCRWFAFFSELVISVIYGALAGVMSTLMMAGSVGEQEYLVKLAQLKAWMKAKHLPMHERTAIMAFFSANHQSASYFDEKAILGFLPLSGACPYNRPCAQQYVGKSQSCMVISGRLIVHAPAQSLGTCRFICIRPC